MAFQSMTFTKSWEDPADFPTYEPDEAQVRADLQYLHNEMRDAFNGLVASLNATSAAANLPISVPGLSAGTIQASIEETLAEVQKAAAGQIVDGSITREKLAASLLARIYGGRLIVSWNTPGAAQTPDSRAARLLQPHPAPADGPGHGGDRLSLAHHPLRQLLLQPQ